MSPKKQGKRSPHPMDIHVGSRVRLRRMMKGLSQDKLAEALGLTFQQVQKYEKGVNRIGASRLFDIGRILEVPVQFFYDDFERSPAEHLTLEDPGAEEASERRDFLAVLATPEGMQLCRAFTKVKSPAVRRRVVDLVRALAEEEAQAADLE